MEKILALLFFALGNQMMVAQVLIKGTVYDRSQLIPLRAVSVMGTSGSGTVTDSLGHYIIKLKPGDSLYFSYLSKSSSKFPLNDISPESAFDISLDIGVDSLPSVSISVAYKNFRLDSIENRREYQKVFDYTGGGYIDNMKSSRRGSVGAGFDLDLFLDAKKDRRMLALQKRLEQDEQDKYIDRRFTRAVVKKVTGLQPPALDSFMRLYRPSYDHLQSLTTDWELYQYISESGKEFLQAWKKEHPKENHVPAKK